MLEKSFAKLNVDYGNLNGGNQQESLHALTGAPTFMYSSRKYPGMKMWPFVQKATEKGWIMSGSCMSSGGVNLVGGHAYSVLGGAELKDASGKVVH